jgi:outer membrane lipoprotein SlyB
MNIDGRIAAALFALAGIFPLAFPAGIAHAQSSNSAAATPRIDGFDVTPVASAVAGAELLFTLYGSPGGTAGVRIGGATGSLILEEVEAGVYEGIYTIARRDKITKTSTATANLRSGNSVASSVLDESLIKGAPARWPGGETAASAAPKIDRFVIDPPKQLVPGAELLFTLEGTPGGSASARISGVRGKTALEEVRRGTYEGVYIVRNRDKIAANTVVTGNLRIGRGERSKVLAQSLVESSPGRQRYSRRAATPVTAVAAAPVCANCGRIETINVVEHKGDGSYLGMIGGGIAGAVLGSQVGHGNGTTVAQVIGAAGGAFAGNEIEKRMKTTKHYEVLVRLENGASQMLSFPAEPVLKIGARVRVENGALVQI